MARKNASVVIDNPDFNTIYAEEVKYQQDLRREFDNALTGVDKDDGDAVFDALFKKFRPI
jgi:hypothetical protein